MYEITYHKDYRHNYLIIKSKGQDQNTYQLKMITQNAVKGLLPCRERHINGDLLLFYEITSRQSLKACYEGKRIGMETLRKFFLQLKQVSDILQKYLLEENGLWLEPEYVFCNIETGEFSFLFFPEPLEDGLLKLLDFFMEKVDNEDIKAVEAVYKTADMVRGQQFVTDEILSWFQYDFEVDEHADKEAEDRSWKQNGFNMQDKPYICEMQDGKTEIHTEPEEQYFERSPETKSGIKRAAVPASAGILGACILLYLGNTYELSYREEGLVRAGWTGIALLILTAAFLTIAPLYKQKRKNSFQPISQEETRSYVRTCEAPVPEKEEEIGNTVFIPWMESSENKLYAMDRKNKHHIDLNRLPLSVGKMAGAVDVVINDQSISRMHARFVKTGNQICILDLNSTNGTFRNGMRLEPNASEVIEPGDEIRLGRLKFIYR